MNDEKYGGGLQSQKELQKENTELRIAIARLEGIIKIMELDANKRVKIDSDLVLTEDEVRSLKEENKRLVLEVPNHIQRERTLREKNVALLKERGELKASIGVLEKGAAYLRDNNAYLRARKKEVVDANINLLGQLEKQKKKHSSEVGELNRTIVTLKALNAERLADLYELRSSMEHREAEDWLESDKSECECEENDPKESFVKSDKIVCGYCGEVIDNKRQLVRVVIKLLKENYSNGLKIS